MTVRRFKCKYLRPSTPRSGASPHNGIPAGTEFETSPRTTSVPSAASRARAGSGAGASRSGSRRVHISRFCNYVYDEKRGEPHRGIARGTKFADLPDYCCRCAVDSGSSTGWVRSEKRPLPARHRLNPPLFLGTCRERPALPGSVARQVESSIMIVCVPAWVGAPQQVSRGRPSPARSMRIWLTHRRQARAPLRLERGRDELGAFGDSGDWRRSKE